MTASSNLFIAAALLLSSSTAFLPSIQPRTASSLAASSEESNSRLNQEIINELMTDADGLGNSFIDEPTNDLPSSKSSIDIKVSSSGSTPASNQQDPRSIEFNIDTAQTTTPSPHHLAHLELETRLKSIYVPVNSNEYWELKDEIVQLEKDLQMAKSQLGYHSKYGVYDGNYGRYGDEESPGIKAIETMLRRSQARDAEHVYRVTTQAARVAERMGRTEEAERYALESERAKMMLPQFNLEGLWVGKYGSHGFEMINITYSGNQLIAYKVTGDHNIPRGHISFTADLSPPGYSSTLDSKTEELDPIDLSEGSAKKWGTKRLPRYPGRGQAAEPDYQNPQYLEGQLVVIGPGDYFSFAWIPLEHQIFFGRPSPELTLKMLREGGPPSITAGVGLPVPTLKDGNIREMRDYVSRCMEVTLNMIDDDMCEGKKENCGVWYDEDDEEMCYFQ